MYLKLIAMIIFLFLSGCQTKPPASAVPPAASYHNYLAVLNGNGGYFSFVFLNNSSSFQGPAIGNIYPQSVKSHEGQLFAVNSSGNNIKIFESIAPFLAPRVIQLDPGSNPVEIAFGSSHDAYVSCFDSNRILKVDLNSLTVTATLMIPSSQGQYPDGLAIANGKLFVALPGYSSGRTVAIVDLTTFTFTASSPITVGENPQTLLETGGKIHSICTSGYNLDWSNKMQGSVHIIDPLSDTVEKIVDLMGSDPAFATAVNGRVFVSGWDSGLMAYDLMTGLVLRGPWDPVFHPVSGGLQGLTTDGSSVFVCSSMSDEVLIFDPLNFSPRGSFSTGSQPSAIAYVP